MWHYLQWSSTSLHARLCVRHRILHCISASRCHFVTSSWHRVYRNTWYIQQCAIRRVDHIAACMLDLACMVGLQGVSRSRMVWLVIVPASVNLVCPCRQWVHSLQRAFYSRPATWYIIIFAHVAMVKCTSNVTMAISTVSSSLACMHHVTNMDNFYIDRGVITRFDKLSSLRGDSERFRGRPTGRQTCKKPHTSATSGPFIHSSFLMTGVSFVLTITECLWISLDQLYESLSSHQCHHHHHHHVHQLQQQQPSVASQ